MEDILLSLLTEMRSEQREDYAALTGKVDEGFTRMATHFQTHVLDDVTRFGNLDKRLEIIENAGRILRWTFGAVTVALLGSLIDVLVNHLHLILIK